MKPSSSSPIPFKPSTSEATSKSDAKSGAKSKSKSKSKSAGTTPPSAPGKRGGARPGAGRPAGQGRYGEATKPVRLPVSMIDEIMDYVAAGGRQPLPLFSCAVAAGFPSPADDHLEGSLDLNDYLVKHPAATFFVRVSGDSMIKAGIHEDDILVVDRSIEARHGKIIIAAVDGQLTVKRLHHKSGKTMLMPENDRYEPITISDEASMVIWGVVTNVIHSV